MKGRKIVFAVLIPVLLIIGFGAYLIINYTRAGRIETLDHLDDVVVTVDGKDITLGDLSFYILYEESKVERLARIYNPDSPKDYWNSHTNGHFVDVLAKETVIESAIHDAIFLEMISDRSKVMGPEQKKALEEARSKFWEGLYEEQLENFPVDYNEINRVIKNISDVQYYQHIIAQEMETTYASLNWEGYDYQNQILPLHEIVYNNDIWDRVVLGEISIKHENVSYINGLTDEERQAIQENK